VRPELSKTRRRRAVELSANAIQWIDEAMFGVPVKGRVCPFSFTTLVRKRAENHERSGVAVVKDSGTHIVQLGWRSIRTSTGY
jgi:hypothetical protein